MPVSGMEWRDSSAPLVGQLISLSKFFFACFPISLFINNSRRMSWAELEKLVGYSNIQIWTSFCVRFMHVLNKTNNLAHIFKILLEFEWLNVVHLFGSRINANGKWRTRPESRRR